MAFMKQTLYLMKQELNSARRSRYIIISFVLLPFFMWGLEGGVQVLVNNTATSSPSNLTIYVTNEDNGTAILKQPFQIPINFENYQARHIISANTTFNLSGYFIAYLNYTTSDPNSTIHNAKIIDNQPISTVNSLKEKGKVEYWIDINSTFSSTYNNKGLTAIHLDYLQKTILGPTPVVLALNKILLTPPFSVINVEKYGVLDSSEILLGGSSSADTFSTGFAGFLGILLAVIVPAPFVATSIAGEREKKTLESLLALPISRNNILLGKLLSGMVLVGVFAVLNIAGMELYVRITSGIKTSTGSSYLAFDLNPTTIFAITLAMGLSAFIAIGLGISLVSFAKDVRTSESLYQFVLMIPAMLVGLVTMVAGVPENTGGVALLLYLIPFTHAIAIFQKILRPGYYNIDSLLGFGLVGDLIFHFVYLILSILVVLWLASKSFEREGIIN